MSILEMLSLWFMAFAYIYAGITHFINEKFFLKIVPPYLPYHRELVAISGVIEMILGALLFVPSTRFLAAWAVIALLIAIYPANIYMLQARLKGEKFKKTPIWGLCLRLAFQFILIFWAYSHTYSWVEN